MNKRAKLQWFFAELLFKIGIINSITWSDNHKNKVFMYRNN